VVVTNEEPANVVVSSRDVNRVHCDAPVQDVIWSKEQPVEVNPRGRDVFVKFLVRRTGEVERRADAPVDLHVVCAERIYTLILQPREIDTVTVQLGDPQVRAAKDALATWSGLPLETQIRKLTLAGYRGEIIPGAQSTDGITLPQRWSSATVHDATRTQLPGVGLSVVAFDLTSRVERTLDERDFIDAAFMPGVLGVTVEPRRLPPGGTARVILVARSVGDGR
jgi:hypothetical protein